MITARPVNSRAVTQGPGSAHIRVMTKPILTTVTFADGTTASRTSERYAYTHAVTVTAEDPDLLAGRLRTVISLGEHDCAKLLDALEHAEPVIRSRGITTRGRDLDFSGNPSWSLYEAQLDYSPAGVRTRLVTWCNSQGVTKDQRPVSEELRRLGLGQVGQIRAEVAKAETSLQALTAGTYDLGTPEVIAWSTSRQLAEKALRSKAADYPTRRAGIVTVD